MNNKWHPLHAAAISGNLAAVAREYNKEPGKQVLEYPDCNGYTAIHFATVSRNESLVEWFAKLESDLNKKCKLGKTPIFLACEKGLENIVKILLEHGASSLIVDNRGWGPLHVCASENNCRIARLIIQYFPDSIKLVDKDGMNCLHVAIEKNSNQFLDTIISIFPELEHFISTKLLKNRMVTSPSPHVAKFKTWTQLDLSDTSGSINEGSMNQHDQQKCIDIVRKGNCAEMMAFLQENSKYDLNKKLKNGSTLLIEAGMLAHLDMLKLLLEAGADPNIKNKKEKTILQLAILNRQNDAISLLCENGALTSSSLQEKKKLLDLAEKCNNIEAKDILLRYKDMINSYPASRSLERGKSYNESESIQPPKSVSDWLTSIALSRYTDMLQNQGFDSLRVLQVLTESDLVEMGMLLGHRRLFIAELDKLKQLFPYEFKSSSLETHLQNVSPEKIVTDMTDIDASKTSESISQDKNSGGYTTNKESKNGNVEANVFTTFQSSCNTSHYANAGKLLNGGSESSLNPVTSALCDNYMSAKLIIGEDYGGTHPFQSMVSSLSMSICSSVREVNIRSDSQDVDSSRANDTEYSAITTSSSRNGVGNTIPVKELIYSELEVGHTIGEGSFGTVRVAYWRGMRVAVKFLKSDSKNSVLDVSSDNETSKDVDSSSVSSMKDIQHESQTMARVCNHAFIIQFIGIVLTPIPCVVTAFYVNGSVEDLLVKNSTCKRDSINLQTLIRFSLETIMGVRHLHLEGVVHRDLAARNLLIDDNFHIRVADFGFSRAKEEAASKGYTNSDIGPIRWSAPEAMRRKIFSESSDVFSFGVVMYEIFVHKVPWHEYNTLDVAIRVCSGERMEIPSHIPHQICGVMKACWMHDSEKRPSFPAILSDLKKFHDEIESNSSVKNANISCEVHNHNHNRITHTNHTNTSMDTLPPSLTCFMKEISNISIDNENGNDSGGSAQTSRDIAENGHSTSTHTVKSRSKVSRASPSYNNMSPLIL